MKIYGVALLAGCFITGKLFGHTLGVLIGIDGDVGGIGFAMIFLILSSIFLRKKGWLEPESEKGIAFWSSMFLPIIIALSAPQNVNVALDSGFLAIIAGVISTVVCLLLVPVISKIGKDKNSE